jgi:hypothetical protein
MMSKGANQTWQQTLYELSGERDIDANGIIGHHLHSLAMYHHSVRLCL